MNDNPGQRRNIPAVPTADPASEPVPTGQDVIGVALSSNDSTLNTQI
jgi:hypothetical protein